MVPATGPGPDPDRARAALAEIACPAPDRFDDPALLGRAPDPGVRAGLVALAATIAEPLLDAFADGRAVVRELGIGPTASPGRVIGPHVEDPDRRVVNERYRAEHPALLALVATPGAALPDPLRYDADLGPWLSEHLGREWLSVQTQLRAAVALGVVDEDDLVSASGLDAADALDAFDAFDVHDAVACFRSRS